MSSTLVSHQHTLHRPLPPLTQARECVPRDLNSYYIREPGGQDPLSRWIQTSATIEHGLGTPPREMSGNPLLEPNVGGFPYQSIPAIKQNNVQTSLSTVASTRYISKAPPVQTTSPTSKNENAPSREQPRRAAAESNSIVSYLQIPPTINDSKGSLAEFAAQVYELFRYGDPVLMWNRLHVFSGSSHPTFFIMWKNREAPRCRAHRWYQKQCLQRGFENGLPRSFQLLR